MGFAEKAELFLGLVGDGHLGLASLRCYLNLWDVMVAGKVVAMVVEVFLVPGGQSDDKGWAGLSLGEFFCW